MANVPLLADFVKPLVVELSPFVRIKDNSPTFGGNTA